MLAVIFHWPNCPRCDGEGSYSTLVRLGNLKELLDWIVGNTSDGFYVKELYEDNLVQLYNIQYEFGNHSVESMRLSFYSSGDTVAKVYRDPYKEKSWKVDCDIPKFCDIIDEESRLNNAD